MSDIAISVLVREESPRDIDAIHSVTMAAFANARYSNRAEQFIVAALRTAGALSVSLVAESAGKVIGHVAVSPVEVSDGSRNWFGLGPISVLPAYQRKGVGSKLMREALNDLREGGAAGCVLLGNPKYYGRFGFKHEPTLILPDVPAEYFQALAFRAAMPHGVVTYHRAFDATE